MRIQERYDLNIPAWSETELIGLVEKWANGSTWDRLMANTSLDEGDVVRVLRRTIDLLAQIPYCLATSKHLKRNAVKALHSLNRFPVREVEDVLKEQKEYEKTLNPATERLSNSGKSK